MPNLNKKLLDSTSKAPKGKRVVLNDDKVKGLCVRVTDKGVKSFVVRKKKDKKDNLVTLGRYPEMTVEQARQKAQEALGLLSAGINPKQRTEKLLETITLRQVFQDYKVSRGTNLKENTIKDYNSVLNNYFSDWLHKPLASISRAMVEKRHREITKSSPSRANTSMRHLRAYFKYAIGAYENSNHEPIFHHNPVEILNHSKSWNREKRKNDVVKPYNLKTWYQAVQELPDVNHRKPNQSETVKDLLVFILFTGLRRREASTLQWSNIDFQERSLTIHNTKNHESHTLPLTEFLVYLLKRRKSNTDSEFVFEGITPDRPINDPKKQVKKVRESCDIYFTIHGLRRTFATAADGLDMSQYALKRLLNHKDSRDVTSGYVITDVERLREPMQRITDYFLEKINEDS